MNYLLYQINSFYKLSSGSKESLPDLTKEENEKLFEEIFKKTAERFRALADDDRAMRMIGSLPGVFAARKEVRNKLDDLYKACTNYGKRKVAKETVEEIARILAENKKTPLIENRNARIKAVSDARSAIYAVIRPSYEKYLGPNSYIRKYYPNKSRDEFPIPLSCKSAIIAKLPEDLKDIAENLM